MKIDRKSLAYQIIIPIFMAIVSIAIILLLFINNITGHILDDYHRFIAASQTEETRRLLDSSLAELTTARLLGNPTVVEAKQQGILKAIDLAWQRLGISGVIAEINGKTLFTTLPADLTARLLAAQETGYIHLDSDHGEYYGQISNFYPWQWRIITVTTDNAEIISTRKIFLLLPIVAVGSILMVLLLLYFLKRNLRQPVSAIVTAVEQQQLVTVTGVTELDKIASAYNASVKRLQEKETRIRLLLLSAAEGIYGVDIMGICTFCNPSCCRMLGYTDEQELLGQNIHTLIHHSHADGSSYPEDKCPILHVYQTIQENHADNEVFWRADGTSFPVEYWSHPIIEDGKVTGAVVTFFDITIRKQAEEALNGASQEWQTTFDSTTDLIMLLSPDGTIKKSNRAFAQFCGISAPDLIGRKCFEVMHQAGGYIADCPLVKMRQSLIREEMELTIAARTFIVSVDPVLSRERQVMGVVHTMHDITERKRTEEQLLQAQKMEGIGHLAGGVAHDFNNVLNVVLGCTVLLRNKIPEGDTLRDYLNQIENAVMRGSTITRQILAFSRKQSISIQPIDLNEAIAALQKMLRRLVRESINIHVQLPDKPVVVMADPGQLDQILINLATNACDAMPGSGTLGIALESIHLDSGFIQNHGYGAPGDYAILTVTDTGSGMVEAVRTRIFEPFFTTKEVGKGTGLGLAMVYGIVKRHNGYINVYSEPDRGTVFKIYLPLVKAAVNKPEKPAAAAFFDLLKGTETILTAEDDQTLRKLTREVLEMAGYTVLEAEDGAEAVRLFKEQSTDIHLVILDGIMPRKNGKEALLEMRAERPELKAIIMSGYAEEIFTPDDLTGLKVTFIPKPVYPDQLLKKIRETLDS